MDRDAFTRLGKYLDEQHSDQLSTQLSVYQSALINFAVDHGSQIKLNKEFRLKFTEVCQLIGLDPVELLLHLESRGKQSGEFLITLAIKIVEVCQETRDLNGGLISFKELLPRIQNNVNLVSDITETDLKASLDILNNLGEGYEILTINNKKWLKSSIASTTTDISSDQKKVYEICTFMGGYVTKTLLIDNYGWDKVRCKTVLDDMIMNGFLWIDNNDGELMYWEPSWISFA